jgi:DNA-directed RNA polymerase specialized sigma24 family protein
MMDGSMEILILDLMPKFKDKARALTQNRELQKDLVQEAAKTVLYLGLGKPRSSYLAQATRHMEAVLRNEQRAGITVGRNVRLK